MGGTYDILVLSWSQLLLMRNTCVSTLRIQTTVEAIGVGAGGAYFFLVLVLYLVYILVALSFSAVCRIWVEQIGITSWLATACCLAEKAQRHDKRNLLIRRIRSPCPNSLAPPYPTKCHGTG
jgi:hypothetical protein